MFPDSTYRNPTITSTHNAPKLDLITHPSPTRVRSQHSSKTTTTNQCTVSPFDIPYEDTTRTTQYSSDHMTPDEMNTIIHEMNSLYFDTQQESLWEEYDNDDGIYTKSPPEEHEELLLYTSSTACCNETALQAYNEKLSIIFDEIILFNEENIYDFNTSPLIKNSTCSLFKYLKSAHQNYYAHPEHDYSSKPKTHPSDSESNSDSQQPPPHNFANNTTLHPPPNASQFSTDFDSNSDSDDHSNSPPPPSITPQISTPIITPFIRVINRPTLHININQSIETEGSFDDDNPNTLPVPWFSPTQESFDNKNPNTLPVPSISSNQENFDDDSPSTLPLTTSPPTRDNYNTNYDIDEISYYTSDMETNEEYQYDTDESAYYHDA